MIKNMGQVEPAWDSNMAVSIINIELHNPEKEEACSHLQVTSCAAL